MGNYTNEYIDFRKGDCQELIKTLPDASVNIILTDPPYLYLKGQKLEREFDEKALFAQWKRVLKPGGFIVMFGRGTSFYRWNYFLSELGFEFKEEIIWDKSYISSPVNAVSRVHETVSIYANGKGSVNKVKVPYLEMKFKDIPSVIQDIKRLNTVFTNNKSFEAVKEFLETGVVKFTEERIKKHNATVQSEQKSNDRCVSVARGMEHGMNEKTIINETRDHFDTFHPTQKPVSILKRLLALVKKSDNDVVLDCFGGSGSTGEACIEEKLKCILFEIDDEYFELAKQRLEKAYRNRDTQITMF